MSKQVRNDMLSVSELAERLGVSKQTIYNRVRKGIYASTTFNRGKMRGILVYYNEKG